MTQTRDMVKGVAVGILRELDAAVTRSAAGGTIEFAYLTGSHLYGLANESSDIDVRGVHLARTEGLFRMNPLFGSRDSASTVSVEGCDAQSTEIGKFCHLACQGNPQVLEALYVPEWAVLRSTSLFRAFVHNRDAFLSQRVVYAYLGYTWSNLSQAVNHVFRAIEQRDPSRAQELIGASDCGCRTMDWLLTNMDGFHKMDILDVCDVTWDEAAETRATKAACHVLRLLSCLEHFVVNREFTPDLGDDLPLVRGVRRGEVPLADFRREVLARRDRIGLLVAGYGLCALPENPDRDRIDGLLVMVRRQSLV